MICITCRSLSSNYSEYIIYYSLYAERPFTAEENRILPVSSSEYKTLIRNTVKT